MKIGTILLSGLFAVSMTACAHGGEGHHGKKGHHDHHKGHDKGHHGKHSKMWESMDADNDGTVTKAEFDKAHSDKFAKMDANSDGKVTKEEKMAYKTAKSSDKKSCCQ